MKARNNVFGAPDIVIRDSDAPSYFTPGPWIMRKPLYPASPFKWEVNALNNGVYKPYIADVRSLDAQGWDNSEANARLIAAAPDLLAALEIIADGVEEIPEGKRSPHEKAVITCARAALAKATQS